MHTNTLSENILRVEGICTPVSRPKEVGGYMREVSPELGWAEMQHRGSCRGLYGVIVGGILVTVGLLRASYAAIMVVQGSPGAFTARTHEQPV